MNEAILILLSFFAATSVGAATVSDWQHDLDEILAKVEGTHPNAFSKIGKLVFLRELAALRTALPSLTEEQRVVRAMRLVASIGDGHTNLEPDNPAFASWYPVRIYEFTDGYFVTCTHKSVSDLAGAQVLEIAGRPAAEVMEAARDLFGADNAYGRKESLYAVHNATLMKGLGYAAANGDLRFKFKLRSGVTVDRVLSPRKSDDTEHYKVDDARFDWRFRSEVAGMPFGKFDEWITAYKGLPYSAIRVADPSRPPHLTARGPYVSRALPERDAYYIQFNQLDDTNLVPFIRKALGEVDEQKPRRLIVDIRYNFGGDGSVVTRLIHQFIKREDNKPWKELYVLTGRKTFSAAVMMLVAFIEHTQFSMIGEPAAAALNSFGDADSIDLPRTGLHMYISTRWHQLGSSADARDFIPVDVPAPFSFADWSEGRDPAVDPILRGDEMRSIPVIALTSGGRAARDAFTERKKRLASVAGWDAPPEIELRKICQDLAEQKRFEDAIETCALSTEIHPGLWSSWFSLGRVQRSAGFGQQGLANYRRVLEIDPMNPNATAIQQLLADAEAAARPQVIRYGATVAQMQAALAGSCKTMNVRRIDPPYLSNIKDKQMQIDCDGFLFAGKPRWAEFVIGDDSLEMVWIMTTKEEEATLLDKMGAAYGQPTHRNAKFAAFANEHAALRLDRPEVLFYSPKQADQWRAEFEK